jgi:hypothetical protein
MLHLMQQLKLRELLSLLQQVVLAAALVLTEFGSEWDFETGNTSGWTTFVDAAGALFRASTTQLRLAVIQVT